MLAITHNIFCMQKLIGYNSLPSIELLENVIYLYDHIGNIDSNLSNQSLQKLNDSNRNFTVYLPFMFDNVLEQRYPNLNLKYHYQDQFNLDFYPFEQYNTHHPKNIKNFLYSFNGGHSVGRRLLVSILHNLQLFNKKYCSKNFFFNWDNVYGDLEMYLTSDELEFYSHWFVDYDSDFNNQTINLGYQKNSRHHINLKPQDKILSESFVNLIAETTPTNYHFYLSEKAFYSIVTRGLFLMYAQPNWYDWFEKYYGFKKFTKIFNYDFDKEQNPVKRIFLLVTQINNFAKLKLHDLHDLHLLEIDTIEYNYNHLMNKGYERVLKQFVNY